MSDRDFIGMARQYEADVLSGASVECKWVRLAIERNVRDLDRQRTADFPYYFDAGAGAAVCHALEQFPHIKGPKAKPVGRREDGSIIWATIDLEPHQAWRLSTFFGWKRVDDDSRRFRVALVMMPRKNAKSTEAAGVLLYLTAADGESGAECYSVATTKDQASIVSKIALEMANRTPEFRDWFGVQVNKRDLEIASTASILKPLASDADSLDGLNTHAAVIDEIHAHPTRDVWDVMETSTGTRAQPVLWGTSTAGSSRVGICMELLTYLQKLLERRLDDESFFGVFYTVDQGDAWDDEATWRKANPNYGVSVKPDDLRRKVLKAKHSPAAKATFEIKHLNIFTNAETSWMPADSWDACADPSLRIEDCAGLPCRISVDLAQVRDIASIVAGFDRPDGRLAVFAKHYMPERTIQDSPIAQMGGWVARGALIATEGNVMDYQRFEDVLGDMAEKYAAREVLFDPALAAHMMQRMQTRLGDLRNDRVIQVEQTLKVLDPAMKELERMVLAGEITHTGDPVLAWMMSNVVVQIDHKEQIYPRKLGGKDSPNKIDGVVATLLQIVRRITVTPPKVSKYESQDMVRISGR